MRNMLIAIAILINPMVFGQGKCMHFCFDVTKNGVSIANDTIHKKDLDSLGFTVTFFNCGEMDFLAPSNPYIHKVYLERVIYRNEGTNYFVIKLHPTEGSLNYIMNVNKDNRKLAIRNTSKSNGKSLRIKPHKQLRVEHFYWTDYLKNLPPGKYEIALDYADEFKETKPPKNDSIIAKYYKTDQPISSGAYMQFSKNTIRFRVVE